MLIYHSYTQDYKSGDVLKPSTITSQHVKERTSRKNALTKKNLIFLESLGFKVKKV